MTSAILVAATVVYLNSLKPRFLKKFRESNFGSYILVIDTEVSEAWIILDTELAVFLPIKETPILKPSKGFTLNIKRMIEGARVLDIEQPDLERIVHIKLQKRNSDFHLYLELFGGGNIVLTDSEGKIIACRRALRVRHRKLLTGHKYMYPPSRGSSIYEVDLSALSLEASRSEKNIAAFLVSNIAISREVIEESLTRLEISRNSPAKEFGRDALGYILNQAKNIVKEVLEGIVEPTIVYEAGKPIKLLPFKPRLKGEKKTFDSLAEAGNDFFLESILPRKMEEIKKRSSEPLKSRQRLISILEEQLTRLIEEAKKRRVAADYLQTKMHIVYEIFQDLKSCLKEGTLGSLVNRRYDKFLIKTIDAEKRWVSFEDDENSYTLDFSLSPFQAIGRLYDRAKKAERGIESLRDKIKNLRIELDTGGEDVFEEVLKPIPMRKKPWYVRFKWTYSSDGFLIVGGRDATTNESLIKSHCEPTDYVFHADILGSPFVVVKTGGRTPTEQTFWEAASFTASQSRAWKEGLGAVDVYWVYPSQVSKTSPSGEYLRKGSFMIQGKRNYLTKVELRLAVGVKMDDDEVSFLVGPISAVEKSCLAHLIIEPGKTKKLEFARQAVYELAGKIGLEMSPRSPTYTFFTDEIVRLLPPGRISKVISR